MSKRVLLLYRDLDETGPYRAAVDAGGADPVLTEAGEPFDLNAFDGVLLMGGGDVNPALYRQAPHALTEEPDDVRDAEECRLIAAAMKLDLPLLAVCRGQQILNVQRGGSLIQHLENADLHKVRSKDRAQTAHGVDIAPGTLLEKIAGATRWDVNSRHHQAVEQLGQGLRVSARSADGVIEAVEGTGQRFMLAVQWHPEDQCPVSAEQRKLFAAFADAL